MNYDSLWGRLCEDDALWRLLIDRLGIDSDLSTNKDHDNGNTNPGGKKIKQCLKDTLMNDPLYNTSPYFKFPKY